MRLNSLVGLDHVVLVVRDLDEAALAWRRFGFTLSPRGTHSPHVGTANHTLMLGPDYIELLGILTETPQNQPTRAFLDRRGEGLESIAFRTTDADQGLAAIRAKGLAGIGPVDFGRPVTLPNGAETQARFRVFFWPIDETPGGVRLFACQHLTRDAVWVPALQHHANTATRLKRVEILSGDPRAGAEHMARLTDGVAEPEPDGAWRVPTGAGRADLVFLDRDCLAARYPGVPLTGLGQQGGASLVVEVADIEAAAGAITVDVRIPRAVCVPPAAANGLILAFESA